MSPCIRKSGDIVTVYMCAFILGACYKALAAFSVINNTRVVVCTNNQQNSEACAYKFIHGMRFLGIFWIVLGHSYGTISEIFCKLHQSIAYLNYCCNTRALVKLPQLITFFLF